MTIIKTQVDEVKIGNRLLMLLEECNDETLTIQQVFSSLNSKERIYFSKYGLKMHLDCRVRAREREIELQAVEKRQKQWEEDEAKRQEERKRELEEEKKLGRWLIRPGKRPNETMESYNGRLDKTALEIAKSKGLTEIPRTNKGNARRMIFAEAKKILKEQRRLEFQKEHQHDYYLDCKQVLDNPKLMYPDLNSEVKSVFDPKSSYTVKYTEDSYDWIERRPPGRMANASWRERFKNWMMSNGYFTIEWKEKTKQLIDPHWHERFEADMFYGGPERYYLVKLMKQVEQETELRITKQLLNSTFSLGNGRKITWGKATLENHKKRIKMLEKHAIGTARTAVRHRQAIKLLRENKVSCLAKIKEKC